MFTGCPAAKTVTIVLRGGASQYIEEAESTASEQQRQATASATSAPPRPVALADLKASSVNVDDASPLISRRLGFTDQREGNAPGSAVQRADEDLEQAEARCQALLDADGDFADDFSPDGVLLQRGGTGPAGEPVVADGERELRDPCCYLVAHNIKSADNLGSLVRTAGAFGAREVLVVSAERTSKHFCQHVINPQRHGARSDAGNGARARLRPPP